MQYKLSRLVFEACEDWYLKTYWWHEREGNQNISD